MHYITQQPVSLRKMPTYEYKCPKGHAFERFYRTISAGVSELPCPECGELATRQLSRSGLVFKGSGFYLTDYGKNAHRGGPPAKAEAGKAEGGKTEGGKSEGEKSEASTSSSATGDSKTESPKPANAPTEKSSSGQADKPSSGKAAKPKSE
jgi:putative FmdB family regulatory protein